MAEGYESLKLLMIAAIFNDTSSFTHRMGLFMHLRNMCGNAFSKRVNPSENLCLKSSTGLCGIGVCPLLSIPLVSKQ